MSRPKRCRFIQEFPDITYFRPCGIPVSCIQDVSLTFDEIEAIRLSDMEEKYHEEGAKEMGISRATFGRILKSARCKIADALINGKALKIEGGNISFHMFRLTCRCGSVRLVKDKINVCPLCKSKNITLEKVKDVNSLPEGPCSLWETEAE